MTQKPLAHVCWLLMPLVLKAQVLTAMLCSQSALQLPQSSPRVPTDPQPGRLPTDLSLCPCSLIPPLPAVPRYHMAFLSLHPQWFAYRVLRVSQQVGLSGSSATAAAALVHGALAAVNTTSTVKPSLHSAGNEHRHCVAASQ